MKASVYRTSDQYKNPLRSEMIEFNSIDELMDMYPGQSLIFHDKHTEGCYVIEVYDSYRE